jgi:hypothetical protein
VTQTAILSLAILVASAGVLGRLATVNPLRMISPGGGSRCVTLRGSNVAQWFDSILRTLRTQASMMLPGKRKNTVR